jgi:predicted extracellular nuclease
MKDRFTSLSRRSSLLIVYLLVVSFFVGFYRPIPTTLAASNTLVISQVYGAGGANSSATYTHDFIEIFNLSANPINLSGWKVEYLAAASGNSGGSHALNGIIQPGQFFLIQESGSSTGGALPSPDITGSLNMGGSNGAVKLFNGTTLVDMVGYGTAIESVREGTATAALSATTSAMRVNPCFDTDNNSVDFSVGTPNARNSSSPLQLCDPNATPNPTTPTTPTTPGTPVPSTPIPGCAANAGVWLISTIQGPGETSPCAGQTVTVEGIVVGDEEGGTTTLRGFYLQEEDADQDGNPLTSEGVFIYNNSNNNNVNLGDKVRVTGTVSEYQGQTQITVSSFNIINGGNTVTPATVVFPFENSTYLERFEGMLVEVPQTLYVSEHYQLGRFGQVTLSGSKRLNQPTNIAAPGAAADAILAANNLNRIVLDDSDQDQNKDPIDFGRGGQPLSASNTLRGGDTITGLRGVMTYTWSGNSASGNTYRIRPINALGGGRPNFQPANPRPSSPPNVGGSVKVASFNVLNYFTTLNMRGANSNSELTRQHDKLIQALIKLDADVVGFMEIENSSSGLPLQRIVNGLNAQLGSGTYAYINTGTIGTDEIAVALIYKPGKVSPVGTYKLLTSAIDSRFDTTRNRPMLTQTFREIATNETFTVAVNHLKSKGSACSGDPDLNDGQGNCNQTRKRAAQAIVDWLATNPTGDTSGRYLVIGDLNSYAKEDPIKALEDGGYVNLIEKFGGADAYGYVFDGQWGYLDHALASPDMEQYVMGTASYHINSDEPSILDYNEEYKTNGQKVSLYAADEFRTSDHDPVLIGLDLTGTGTPMPTATPTPTATPVTPTAVTPSATPVTPTAVTPSATATTPTAVTPSATATTPTAVTPSATAATPSPSPETPTVVTPTETVPPSNSIYLPYVGK